MEIIVKKTGSFTGFGIRARQKINWHNSRPDLGQICLIRNCKTIPLQAGLFRGFCPAQGGKDRTKMA